MSLLMSEQYLNVQFVQEVEKHPCLYNTTLNEYTLKDLAEKAWNKIGQKFNMSGLQSKEKWKNLRTVFCRNLRPSSSLGKRKKPYYLSEAMKFALPFIKSQYIPIVNKCDTVSSISVCESTELDNVEQDDEEELDPIEMIKIENEVSSVTYSPSHTPSPPSYTTPVPSPKICTIQISPPISYSRHTPPALVPTKRNRDSNDTCDKYEIYDNECSEEAGTENRLDEMKISKKRFLLSLLPDVYAMNNEQMRSFRIKVLNLIEEVIQKPEQNDVK